MADVLGGALERREKLLLALRQLQPVRARDLADWLGIGEGSASAVLKELAQVGAANREGDLWSARNPGATIAPKIEPADEGARRRLVRPPEPAPEPAPAPSPAPGPGAQTSRGPTRREIIESNRHLLGTTSDPKLAAQLGVPREAVTQFRLDAGIGSFRAGGGMRGSGARAPVAASARGAVREKLEANRDLLGVRSDQSVAAELGVSRSSIVQYRAELGIPAMRPRGAGSRAKAQRPAVRPAPAPARPAPPPAASAAVTQPAPEGPRAAASVVAGFLWVATARVGEEERAVQVAAVDLVGAARAAMASFSGRIERIEQVGSILIAR